MKLTSLALTLTVTLAMGCGDDGLTAFEGVYTIDTWTENVDDCNSDGVSILENQSETAFYIKNEAFFGVEFVNLNQCVDVAECAALAGDDDTINLSTFGFEEGSDSAGWRGTSAFLSGDGAGGPCSGAVSVHLLTSPSDGIIRLETQTKEVEGIGRDSDDFCDTDEAIAMEADLPCTSLEAFEGSFVQDI